MFLRLSCCFAIARIRHMPPHDLRRFRDFKSAAMNDPSHSNPLCPMGFSEKKKSLDGLEGHFYTKITNRADDKHGRCFVNNTTKISVMLHRIAL